MVRTSDLAWRITALPRERGTGGEMRGGKEVGGKREMEGVSYLDTSCQLRLSAHGGSFQTVIVVIKSKSS